MDLILGVDVGVKKIGLSLATKMQQSYVVLPLNPILRTSRAQASQDLASLALEKKVELVVFGLPSNEDTRNRILHFSNLFKEISTIRVDFMNEDLSSKDAQELLQDRKYQARKSLRKNGVLDSISATLILNDYLKKLAISKNAN